MPTKRYCMQTCLKKKGHNEYNTGLLKTRSEIIHRRYIPNN